MPPQKEYKGRQVFDKAKGSWYFINIYLKMGGVQSCALWRLELIRAKVAWSFYHQQGVTGGSALIMAYTGAEHARLPSNV